MQAAKSLSEPEQHELSRARGLSRKSGGMLGQLSSAPRPSPFPELKVPPLCKWGRPAFEPAKVQVEALPERVAMIHAELELG